jgi:hypothetical protein
MRRRRSYSALWSVSSQVSAENNMWTQGRGGNRTVEKTACYRHASSFVLSPRVIEEDGWDM